MLLLVVLLPLAGFLLNASLGRRLTKTAAGAIACGAMIASFLVALVVVGRLLTVPPESRVVVEQLFSWITSGDFNADVKLRLDPLAAVMMLVVTGIGSLIHVYSTAYMHEEPDSELARYFSYLNLFAAFMLLLVLASNFVVMFVGWEGVGLCSYLLIGFWYEKKAAADAGKKAFIVNRIGDVGFVLGILFTFTRFGTVDFQEVARSVSRLSGEGAFGPVSVITLLLFIGATGKSAQFPLYVWLPDAMEGPTPVSALIHAATMVTAGVYMIARNAALFSHAPATLSIVAIVGAATAFMAATLGLVQNDIKRVLAYSTISQLGYMFLAMGVGAYAAGIFHLFTHAFFKALLFLASGAVIHALAGEQDLRRMGGLRRELPLTYWTLLAGALAITGVPLLSGFFSKDEILYRTFVAGHTWLWAVGLTTSLLTAIYMFRLVVLAFHGSRPSDVHEAGAEWSAAPPRAHRLHDAPPAMALALVVLALGSVFAGYVGIDRFLAASFPPASAEHAGEGGLAATLMVVSSLVAVGGIGIAVVVFLINRGLARAVAAQFGGLGRLLEHRYYVDEVYDAAVVQPIRILSEFWLWKAVDDRAIDGAVNAIGKTVGLLGQWLRRLQTGSVRAYAASLILGVVLILGYYLWK